MSFNQVHFRDLILETKDGDWGKDEKKAGFVPYRVIRGGDFPNVEIGTISKVPTCYLKKSTVVRRTLKAGDLLIETAGGTKKKPTGRVIYISQELLDKFNLPVTCASFARFIRIDENKVNPKFIFWYLRNMYEMGEMWQHQVQHTGVARFQWTKFADGFKFDLPTRARQNEIVEVLDVLQKKIMVNLKINQTLESMAQTIFKSWFVDFEPVKAKITAIEAGEDADGVTRAAMRAISGKTDDELDQMQAGQPEDYAQLKTTAGLFPSAMQDSELGEVPEGWALKPLYETAEYVNGAAFKAKYFSEKGSGLPIIKIAELKQGISSGTKYTTEDVKEKYFIDNDDVLYSWSGSPETSLEVFKWFGGKGYLNQHIFKLNFENLQQKYFTYFLLQHMKPLLIRTAQQKQTTGLGHVTVADMKRMLVVYPDNQTLTRFSEVVGPIYEQNSILEREISMSVSLRDTLLPKLLSGELSVDAVELVEAET